MENSKIVGSMKEENKLMDLFLLKSATEWLEKQNWISSPYGGENYLEDFIFRIKLLSGQEWKSIFQDGKVDCGDEQIQKYFEVLKTIDPSIKNFCEGISAKK